jgi:hypothetical protein
MRSLALGCAVALAVGGCFVGTLDLGAGFACDTGSHPCTNGYSCVFVGDAGVGTCVAQGLGTSGGSTSGGSTGSSGTGTSSGGPCSGVPTCAAGGGLLLCDGGVQPCGTGLTCDYGLCLPRCSASQQCDAGAVCDTSVNACVAAPSCSTDGGSCATGEFCAASVCTPVPPVGGSVGSCTFPDGGGMVTVEGPVAVFPGRNGVESLEDGGTVTFFNDTQTLAPVPIVPEPTQLYPSYSIAVPVGTWTALVEQAGVVPTYFPGIEVRSSAAGSSAQIPLETVVELDAMLPLPPLPTFPGVTPQAGHIFWVGLATNCPDNLFLGDFTVGLSPPAPELGYLGGQYQLDASLTAGSASVGEFFAEDAPYAVTRYALSIASGAGTTVLLSGTFTPPTFSAGQTIAVALIYPNFTQ